jgi:hypothetical protein
MRFLKASALMAAMLFSAIAMLGVLSMRGLPARGGSIPGATMNGDVNCDGKVDISDAISVIQYAFYGGTAPCAIAEDPTVLDKLNALGDQITTLQASVAGLAPTWPPKPEDLVNLLGVTPGLSFPQEYTVYTVPVGRLLIATKISSGGGLEFPLLFDGQKVSDPLTSYAAASGYPIPGGTKISIKSVVNNGAFQGIPYSISGYLRNP